MGKIISVTNQKGGVGKTTLTLNLAYALSQTGATVAIVDADPQGSLTRLLRVDPVACPTAAIFSDEPLSWWKVARHGWKALGADLALNTTLNQVNQAIRQEEAIRLAADYVLVDAGPNAFNHWPFMSVSDLWVIPIQIDGLSTMEAGEVIHTAEELGKEIMVVLNRFDGRARLSIEMVFNLLAEARIDQYISPVRIPESQVINQANMLRSPVGEFEQEIRTGRKGKKKASQFFDDLAQELKNRLAPEQNRVMSA